MRLLLYILLLFAFNTKAQITSSVYSGARFGGVVDTGGGTYITLPGCSTQTQVTGVAHLKNDFDTWGYDWRNTGFYSDSTSPSTPMTSENSACRALYLQNAWMVESPKYLSIFADADYDGEYETLLDNTFLLTTDSSSGVFWYFYADQIFEMDYGMVRVIAADVPLSNSCPTEVNGMVLDGYVEVFFQCMVPNYTDTIIIAGCDDYPIYVPDFVDIPDSISFGGVYTNGYYKKDSLNAIQVMFNEDDNEYYCTVDLSGWEDIDPFMYYSYFVFGSNDGVNYDFISDNVLNVDDQGYVIDIYIGYELYQYYRMAFGLAISVYPTGDMGDECLGADFFSGDAVLTILDATAELDN